jgi:hypothetical protein
MKNCCFYQSSSLVAICIAAAAVALWHSLGSSWNRDWLEQLNSLHEIKNSFIIDVKIITRKSINIKSEQRLEM